MDSWALLEERFPFEAELAEVEDLNGRFGLAGDVAFSATLRPVFFVGDLDARPEILLIGLKPGLNAQSNAAFQQERESLQGAFSSTGRRE